jgi:hypothetical protein
MHSRGVYLLPPGRLFHYARAGAGYVLVQQLTSSRTDGVSSSVATVSVRLRVCSDDHHRHVFLR